MGPWLGLFARYRCEMVIPYNTPRHDLDRCKIQNTEGSPRVPRRRERLARGG